MQASPLQVGPASIILRQVEDLNHAGLVVRDAEGRVTYAWVPFAEEEINGIEFLKRSGIPVVTVGFGALGEGVCSIGGQGCGVSECRRTVCQASAADAPYWQYFQQDRDDPVPLAVAGAGRQRQQGPRRRRLRLELDGEGSWSAGAVCARDCRLGRSG